MCPSSIGQWVRTRDFTQSIEITAVGRGAGCAVDDLGFERRFLGRVVSLFRGPVDRCPGAGERFGGLFGDNFPTNGIDVERPVGAADFHFRAAGTGGRGVGVVLHDGLRRCRGFRGCR